ncbi:MAG TPA: hypothetical protein VKV26_23230 [Dehalococcoidia bacterium]|nr:hypothetical protein [Dehalococcoidia bacterium]
MAERGVTCATLITPVSGPGLLWCTAGEQTPRNAYHLHCWEHRRQTFLEVDTLAGARAAREAGRAAASRADWPRSA